MKITFLHTLYNRPTTMMVAGDIEFHDGCAWFKSMGHGYRVEMEYIISIEKVENED